MDADLNNSSESDVYSSNLDCPTYFSQETTSAMGTVASEGRSVSTMRTSCDYCGIRKRKCDGEGKRICSLCNKKGLTCTYSKKRPNRPRHSSREQDHENNWVIPHAESLKRCRLSPSPATGLVGMAENVLLGAYFECMGFAPITCERNVREGIVRIMTSRVATPTREITRGTGEMIHHSLPSDPSLCSLWFAVAMGGLVQGQPKEAVGSYIRRAKAAMHAHSKVPTPELARAWLQMALMSAFSGDLNSFSNAVERTVQVVRDLNNQDSLDKMQPGLYEMIKHSQVLLLLLRDDNQEDLKSFVSHDLGPTPQVGNIVTLEEITRFTMHAFRRHGQAVLVDALAKRNRGKPEVENVNPLGADDVEGGAALLLGQRADPLSDVVTTDEYFVGGNSGNLLQELGPTYERLENFARRPSIRSGIGSLVINVPLCFTRIARQDTSGALEAASRAVEVLLSYPGLTRSGVGMHICHILFSILSTLEATETFMKLRAAYNKHLPCEPPIPPMEEWEAVEPYCNNTFCRAKHRELMDHLRPQIEFDISDVVEETPAETIFPNGECATEAEQPSTTGTVCGTQLKQWPEQPTVTSFDLGYQNKLDVGSLMAGGKKRGALGTVSLSSSSHELDAMPGLAVCLGGQDNSLDHAQDGGLHPEDWQIAIDALLQDDTTDLA